MKRKERHLNKDECDWFVYDVEYGKNILKNSNIHKLIGHEDTFKKSIIQLYGLLDLEDKCDYLNSIEQQYIRCKDRGSMDKWTHRMLVFPQ